MSIILTGRTRPFRTTGSSSIDKVKVSIAAIAPKQRVLPAQGITDVVNGVLIEPLGIKYPNLGFIRWIGASGAIQGTESTIEFKVTDFLPPNANCKGFEIFVVKGTVFDVQIDNGGGNMDLTEYYTKTEINALFAGLPPQVNAYTKTQMDALLAAKQQSGNYLIAENLQYIKDTDLSVFNFYGSSVPPTPTLPVNWRETDGNDRVVMDWRWDLLDSRWRSIQQFSAVFGYLNAVSATTNLNVSFPSLNGLGVHLDNLTINRSVSGASTTANYWQVSLNALYSSVVLPLASFDTKTDPNGGRTLTTVEIGIPLSSVNLVHALRVIATKAASAPSFSLAASMRFRYERS